jgi:hypothetical protein
MTALDDMPGHSGNDKVDATGQVLTASPWVLCKMSPPDCVQMV